MASGLSFGPGLSSGLPAASRSSSIFVYMYAVNLRPYECQSHQPESPAVKQLPVCGGWRTVRPRERRDYPESWGAQESVYGSTARAGGVSEYEPSAPRRAGRGGAFDGA